jgi:hypothetical protein
MLPRVCFRHKRVDDIGIGWRDEPKMNEYMLWLKKPALCSHCDLCLQEQNVRDTIAALRAQEGVT